MNKENKLSDKLKERAENPESDSASVQSIVHTPGPWEVYKWANGQPMAGRSASVFSSANNDEQAVCDIIQLSPGESPEQEANARLIAAAPDLLDALKEVRHWIGRCADWGPEDPPWHKMSSAIEKATSKVV